MNEQQLIQTCKDEKDAKVRGGVIPAMPSSFPDCGLMGCCTSLEQASRVHAAADVFAEMWWGGGRAELTRKFQ